MTNTFTCGRCKGTFEKEWSDAEASEEHLVLFGVDLPPEDEVVICDQCYTDFKVWLVNQPKVMIDDLPGAERAQQQVRKEVDS